MQKREVRRVLRLADVQEMVPYSGVTIWRKERAGQFPQRIRLGKNAVGWWEDEVLAWLESRPRGMAGEEG